jgi:hypothetical protein
MRGGSARVAVTMINATANSATMTLNDAAPLMSARAIRS